MRCDAIHVVCAVRGLDGTPELGARFEMTVPKGLFRTGTVIHGSFTPLVLNSSLQTSALTIQTRNTIGFPGIRQQLNTPACNSIEFDGIRKLVGLNSIPSHPNNGDKTHAIGIISKTGRYSDTFAHKDIAFDYLVKIL